ncbi:MAG: HAD family hydrolase [Crenarchaeota archaeon]|nr:HAD family hydrolase [Thermoproteota archaeon]
MPIRAVLFDMFDTLMMIEKDHEFYNPAVKSMHQHIVKSGVPVTFSEFREAYIKARDLIYEKADATLEEPHFNVRVQNALNELGFIEEAKSKIVQGATEAFYQKFMDYVRIDENAVSVLEDLHESYNLGVVSNFAIPECVEELLEREKINQLFNVVIVSGGVNRRKPNPDIFSYALNKIQISAAEAIFVGDTVDADVIGPKQLGIKTIYIDRRPQKELEQNQPDYIIKKLSELTNIVKQF